MNNKQTFGITINFNLLTLLFIGLKLTHYINWSWWWVLAPTWIPFAIGFTIIILWLLIFHLIIKR